MNVIHLSTALKMLISPEPVSIVFLTKTGSLRSYQKVYGMKRHHYSGTRNIKVVDGNSRRIIKIRDCLILMVNGMEVIM